jgi:aldose 1-epimerase
MLELTAGAMRCVVLPACGGSLGGWWLGESPLLRPSGPEDWASGDATRLAGFPLVPFSNRIADAHFDWQGTAITLPRNQPDEGHALHGLGWQRPWQVVELAPCRAVLELTHDSAGDWPWPFVARQEIVLTPDALTLTLSARNLAAQAVPLAIGHHPYFASACTTLHMTAAQVWLADANNLPDHAVPPANGLDFSQPASVAERVIDNCYAGVDWPVQIGWPGRDHGLRLSASAELPCAVVYSSATSNAFCVEPVAHLSNALNLPQAAPAMPVIAPGATFACTITMQVTRG